MKSKSIYILLYLLLSVIFFNSFIQDNPYFKITKQDVELKIPKGFPKPIYDFNKNKLTPEGFVLGRKLFYDPILSKDSSISCSSCHQRIAAFAHIDHPLSHGINGMIGKRNVMSLQNLIWRDAFMWDGGVNNLEVQPINPITNPIEMDETLSNVVEKLKHNKEYVEAFYSTFHDNTINSERILKSLAQFTGLMISSDSRLDRYKEGKETFTETELNGLKLFQTKCANCHAGALFTDNSYRNNGLKTDTALRDRGRAIITGKDEDNIKFKVPTLRNIEMTYPYMHDGRFRNLQQVINHYADPKNFDKGYDLSLNKIGVLTEKEKGELIAFLKTLTDKVFLYDRRFADPNIR